MEGEAEEVGGKEGAQGEGAVGGGGEDTGEAGGEEIPVGEGAEEEVEEGAAVVRRRGVSVAIGTVGWSCQTVWRKDGGDFDLLHVVED